MKVMVKATGEVFEIASYATIPMECCDSFGEPLRFCFDEVEILSEGNDLKESESPDYWEKLLHQYAGMAMQGILSSDKQLLNILFKDCEGKRMVDVIADNSNALATAVVKKLREGK